MTNRVCVAALSLALAGCGDNGPPIPPDALAVEDALRVAPREAKVYGYFFDPRDDVARICSKKDEYGDCTGSSLLVIGADPYALPDLEEGCCSIGFYSKHKIVLQGLVAHGRLVVTHNAASDL
jgi:predicted small lipoprotein YifL